MRVTEVIIETRVEPNMETEAVKRKLSRCTKWSDKEQFNLRIKTLPEVGKCLIVAQ